MKNLFIILLLLTSGLTKAQPFKGIKFEHGLTWAQIKAKARQQNKYIFLDAYTSDCVPCKVMAKEVFPQQKVGDFFNANFINVSVQLDVSKRDNPEIKRWYRDARLIKATYPIHAYPTFLFLNPQGDLVHTQEGAILNPDEFIAKAQSALNPITQYATLKKQYEQGKRDSTFLLTLSCAALQANDWKFIPTITNTYLATQNNLLTDENLKFVLAGTTKSTDPGFNILRRSGTQADAVLGKGKSAEKVRNIVFQEVVFPEVMQDGKITDLGWGMAMYSGQAVENVNWADVKTKLDAQYPDLSEAVLLSSKPTYYQFIHNWPRFCQSVTAYLASPYADGLNPDYLSSYAENVFRSTDDTTCLKTALSWCDKLLVGAGTHNVGYLYTYSHLQYKLGKKEEAITAMEKAYKAAVKGQNEVLATELDKMKKGEKTW
ncbi:DUF255 domain-containing protein [Mucilaginibacter robiniae]|uniref:DUF255 domain-containing protein n=1 Tax=Mucilaginibacter robiniae TaxID=2728022 RepID=A0A7L5DZY9_9SPHI|nr:DUF255 domain-containing protein [Mucilaginibacter robiniae]QJD96341.1 DUF255 domain-containing protein [Mucilaginibacter robiniae]